MTGGIGDGISGWRLWLFDFDNTLAALATQVDWAASRRELESFLRLKGVDETLLREFPSRNLPLYNALFSRSADSLDAALIRGASGIIESYELRGIENAAPLTGAVELLLSLSARGKRIAIVTSNSSSTVRCWLANHQLMSKVGAIVGRDSLLPLKPSPDMVRRALELNRSFAAEAVMVGDSEADLIAAHCAGVAFLGVASDPDARTRMQKLGIRDVFSSPGDLGRRLFGSHPA
ncbi:MAG: HAD-IA family hydrolase [Deltaproteobacteria bacterium]|nr:HAD-IA family hydrolase [Deltaproteobacteria bacterium]